MDRRDKTRYARRLQVHFWKRGEAAPFSGYTANISKEGMFIGTASPVPKGTRIRIEILDEENGFMVEGVVAHAARVSPQLQKIKASGMGVRLLQVEDLVNELMPRSRPKKRPTPKKKKDEPAAPAPGPAEKRMKPAAKMDPAAVSEDLSDESEAAKRRKLPTLPDDELRSDEPASETRVYPLRFTSLPNFLSVLQRDIEQGGVFIPTEELAKVHETVLVELQIPSPVGRSIQLEAVVVSLNEAGQPAADDDGESNNLLSGMAVEFIDGTEAIDRLNTIVYGE